jgi:cysteinyl-tRNA synthetase
MLHLYNSLTRQKAPFKPLKNQEVKLYVCGMTVYDFCHVGHARVMVVFDVLVRYLRFLGFNVTYVRNITDIDDKIIKRAQENTEDFNALTQRFIDAMHEDADALNILRPDIEPRATEFINQIIEIVNTLLDKGYAYIGENGDIFYAVEKFKDYGKLSGKNLDELQAGSRVDIQDAKQNPLDFVLWKMAKPDEPSWDSPWGKGRPGWHIECSAMSTHCLGNHFDIHGGGMDLQFPHHENEIAQSEAATGETFVNTWLHNGFVRVNEEKMSKSLGNFFTVREVLDVYYPETVRYFIVASHYRSPLNYSDQQLDTAHQALTRLYTALRDLPMVENNYNDLKYKEKFCAALDDDLNTPEALAVLFEMAREINKLKETDISQAASLGNELRRLASIVGLLQNEAETFLQSGSNNDEEIEQLITLRNTARQNKDWKESDRIRAELKEKGIVLEDSAGKTTWRRE